MKNIRIDYSYSFTVLAAVMIISGYSDIILPLFTAVIIHESGHLFAILALGGQVERLSFNIGGIQIDYNSSVFTYFEDILCALCGPLFGMIAAFAASKLGFTVLSGICMSINLFNLIPVRPLDGGRIIWNVLMIISPVHAETICRVIEISVLCCLCVLAVYLAVFAGNFSLFYISLVLTFYYCKER